MVPVRARIAGVSRGASAMACVAALMTLTPMASTLANQPAMVPPAAAQTAPQDVAADKNRTRFVILLERKVDFQISSLPNPNRVVIDLPDVKVQLPSITGDKPIGLVKSFRGGLAAPGKMRIVIDVTQPVVVERSTLDPGKDGRTPRLAIEIVPADSVKSTGPKKPLLPQASLAGLGTVQPPLPKPAERPEVRAAKSFKPVIVLDPGHGGHDGGAVRNGAIEKEVVLLFSLALRDKLAATNRYKILMTRDTDKFIPLQDRREFGERNKAALFIAIHADYAGSSARGATIYSLRDNVAAELRRSAKGEIANNLLSDTDIRNKLRQSDARDGGAVQGMLADLAQMEVEVTKRRTSLFARSVIEYMGESTSMMSNPDRSAAFAVLRTAKVPAVLIELAYVSNKEDAAKLKSDEWRGKVAESIVTAIDNYFSHQMANNPFVSAAASEAEAAPVKVQVPLRRKR